MLKRYFFVCLFLLVSTSLFGCWEDFYVPEGKKTDIGSELSKDWEKDLDALLQKFVNDKGLVDYAGLQKEVATVNKILASIAKVDPKGWTDEQKMAFWFNAYNIAMIWNILDKFPTVKAGLVSDFSALFFKQRTFEFAGQTLSLDNLEQNVLRRQKPIDNISVSKLNPELHIAVSCAALSCPPIKNSIWKADTVRKELDTRMRMIANDSRFISLENGKVSITSLADWYYDDFREKGGTVGDFFADRIKDNPALVKALRAAGDDKSKLTFKAYNWKLNNWVK